MKYLIKFSLLILCFATVLSQSSDLLDFIPERTESGKLKFSLHNLNPVNMYKVITRSLQQNDNAEDSKANCKIYNKTTNTCDECKKGYYLDSNDTNPSFCSSCSAKIERCGICSSSVDKDTKVRKVQCSNCDFPWMPNKALDTCVKRTVLLGYFLVYIGVALILCILAYIEKPQPVEDENLPKTQASSLTNGLLSEQSRNSNDSSHSE